MAYAIVCPWEAVATGNLLARVFPGLNSHQLYAIRGSPIYAPRLLVGLALTLLVAAVNYRGIALSGVFQDVMTSSSPSSRSSIRGRRSSQGTSAPRSHSSGRSDLAASHD